MKRLIVKCFFFVTITLSQNISENRPISTYSIVALDAETGELGVAVQSHWFSVGFLVPWVKAGVGAVATQSFVTSDESSSSSTHMNSYSFGPVAATAS